MTDSFVLGDSGTSGGGTSSSVKILDTAGTNTATVSAAGAVKVDGSAVTQPVSNASLPLPAGASTAAKQPALGTAGTASADVLSVQGIASMTALKTDGSGVTQPVSGTVTANAGTNLNTSALALDATLTGGTQQAKLTDGTNIASILKSDGTAAGQNAQMVAGTHQTVSFTTTTVQAFAAVDLSNYAGVCLHITSQGGSSNVAFQVSNDGTNWVTGSLFNVNSNTAASTGSGGITTTGVYYGPRTGRYCRINVTGIASGTTAGVLELFTTPVQPLAVGAAVVQSGTWTVTANPAAATTGGYSFTNITTATTTTVKSGAGTLHAIVVNTKGTSSTATIYDNTSASGTKIGTVDTSGGTTTIIYDVAFATGLTIVTAATADITAVFK